MYFIFTWLHVIQYIYNYMYCIRVQKKREKKQNIPFLAAKPVRSFCSDIGHWPSMRYKSLRQPGSAGASVITGFTV